MKAVVEFVQSQLVVGTCSDEDEVVESYVDVPYASFNSERLPDLDVQNALPDLSRPIPKGPRSDRRTSSITPAISCKPSATWPAWTSWMPVLRVSNRSF